jgi:hypothetical protein
MLRRVAVLSLVALTGLPAVAQAANLKFGGFDADETSWLETGGPSPMACEPLGASAAGMPACHVIEHRDALAYKSPARTRRLEDGTPIVATVEEGKLKVMVGAREAVLWSGASVTSVNANLFVSPSGRLVGVEYGVAGGGTAAMVFDLVAPPPALPRPPESRPAVAGNATDRVLAKGGKWEQRLVPCDEAGVYVELTKDGNVAIKIETRCHGDKQLTKLTGGWIGEGDDRILFTFDNAGGEDEKMLCRLSACPDIAEDCLSCAQDDVAFTLRQVRR